LQLLVDDAPRRAAGGARQVFAGVQALLLPWKNAAKRWENPMISREKSSYPRDSHAFRSLIWEYNGIYTLEKMKAPRVALSFSPESG
jgi:hypothetical protein